MDTFLAFVIAAAVTFFFVRGYLKKLTAKSSGGAKHQPPAAMHPCPRCAKGIPQGSAFCAHCGAALAMWSVHRAKVQTGGAAASGKVIPVINASLCVGCGTCVEACPETGTLEVMNGKAILAHPDRCTGQAKCNQACPTQAITLSAGGVLQTVRVPRVKEDFETNVQGMFIAGELGGMGLIKTAINEGKMALEHIRTRIQKEGHTAENGDFDVAIVGAGPAGLSASLTAQQYGMKYLTLEQGEIAATIRQYPRQKFLMAEPVEIPLYGSLYVADGTKEALLAVWETILTNTGVRIQTNEGVQRIARNGRGFLVDTAKGQYHASYVLLAMGRRGVPRKLGVPGEELAKVAYRLIEAETYENNDVLIVGGGDSALEAALALSRGGRNRVLLCHRGTDFQRARERNRQQLEAAEKTGAIRILRNSTVAEIRPDSAVIATGEQRSQHPNDYVLIFAGGESPEDFLRKTGVEIVEKALSV